MSHTVPEYGHGSVADVARDPDTRRDLLTTWLTERGAGRDDGT